MSNKYSILKDYVSGKRNLEETFINDINLKDAFLQKIILKKSCLTDVNLQGSNLERANLQGSKLYSCNLEQSRLRKANLSQAILERINLRNAHLEKVNLSGANLTNVDLTGAYMYGANLKGANLTGAKLNNTFLAAITYDEKTILPFDFIFSQANLALKDFVRKKTVAEGTRSYRGVEYIVKPNNTDSLPYEEDKTILSTHYYRGVAYTKQAKVFDLKSQKQNIPSVSLKYRGKSY